MKLLAFFIATIWLPSCIASASSTFQPHLSGKESADKDAFEWPPAGSLVGFWPLTRRHQLQDVSGNGLNGSALDLVYNYYPGPYGDTDTSTASAFSKGIFQVADPKVSLQNLNAFTISFFIRTFGQTTSIVQYLDSNLQATDKPLSINVQGSNLVIAGGGISQTIEKVVNVNAWNYFALTFISLTPISSRANCSVTLYGRFGQITMARPHPGLCSAQSFSVGGVQLRPTATSLRVACLMIYSTAIGERAIAQNYDLCRSVISSAECGQARTPGQHLPQVPPRPAVAGQFPWIASLKYRQNNELVCSATIVSQYWLLTAASCFANSTRPSNYLVTIGEFDVSLSESFERRHDVEGIIFQRQPYKKLSDIALVELKLPIDFGANNYANEACIDSNDQLASSSSQAFVIGWGLTGRDPAPNVPTTTIRYGSGYIPANGSCSYSWIDGPISTDYPSAMCFVGHPDVTVPCGATDVGSPLALISNNSKLIQVGIFSTRGKNCASATAKLPLFTRLSVLWPWIQSEIACVNPGTNYPTQCPIP